MASDIRNTLKAIDILAKWEFFFGQRSGRLLWADKPRHVQDEDIANFNRDVGFLHSFVVKLAYRQVGSWILSGKPLFPYECSACHELADGRTHFCPYCGALMTDVSISGKCAKRYMTLRQFRSWCNDRTHDGLWSYDVARYCVILLTDISNLPWFKKRRFWRAHQSFIVEHLVRPTDIEIMQKLNASMEEGVSDGI